MTTGAPDLVAVAAGAAVCLAASPYLAALTLTVPDRGNAGWWRPITVSTARRLATAAVGLVLGALAGAAAGWTAALPAHVALAVAASPLVVIDYEHHRLPDRLVRAAALAAVVLLAVAAGVDGRWGDYLRALEAAAAAWAVLALLWFISPRSFGLGDVKLGAVLGGYLGWAGWLELYYGLFAGFLLGCLVGIALMLSRRATLKSALAFGPMLIFGALTVLAVAPAVPLAPP